MDILQKLLDAQLQLQSTQRNWECLFKCNDLLGEVIRELEERPTKRPLDFLKDGGKKPDFVIFDDIHNAGK
jgi:hypothetical protein